MLILALPTFAADGFDAHGFHFADPEPDVHAPLTVSRYSLGTPMGLAVSGLFEYAKDPLVQYSSDGTTTTRTPVVGDVFALNLAASLSPWAWLRIDASLPLFFASTDGLGESQGFHAGDARLAALVSVIRPDREAPVGFGLAVRPHLDIPLGGAEAWLGQDGVSGGGVVAGTLNVSAFSATANVGLQFQPTAELGNLDNADQVLLGLAVGYAFGEHVGATIESTTAFPLEANTIAGAATPSELLVSGRYVHKSGAHGLAGVAFGLTDGAGAASWRFFVGGGFGATPTPPPPPDTDGDGIVDPTDACPGVAETRNQYQDEDGCPDALGHLYATAADPHGKSVADAAIELFDQPGTMQRATVGSLGYDGALPGSQWKLEARARCLAGELVVSAVPGDNKVVIPMKPARDAQVRVKAVDGKGQPVPTAEVSWGETVGPCADPDATFPGGTGVVAVGAGHYEIFVTAPGYTTWHQDLVVDKGQTVDVEAKLLKSRVQLTETQVVILDKVFFDTGKATIKPESLSLLDEVAQTIRRAHLQRIEVAGHTDDVGDDASNLKLSQARAESVRDYLIKVGVDPARLSAVGYGETRPIEKKTTKAARAANRRVEFTILQGRPVEP